MARGNWSPTCVFLGKKVETLRAEVPRGAPERTASDHLPLPADLRVTAGPA
jgi:endonuclease/exonuclease/phosphatase family metal-dependent hydrolase